MIELAIGEIGGQRSFFVKFPLVNVQYYLKALLQISEVRWNIFCILDINALHSHNLDQPSHTNHMSDKRGLSSVTSEYGWNDHLAESKKQKTGGHDETQQNCKCSFRMRAIYGKSGLGSIHYLHDFGGE